jgi:hypothetical protein
MYIFSIKPSRRIGRKAFRFTLAFGAAFPPQGKTQESFSEPGAVEKISQCFNVLGRLRKVRRGKSLQIGRG